MAGLQGDDLEWPDGDFVVCRCAVHLDGTVPGQRLQSQVEDLGRQDESDVVGVLVAIPRHGVQQVLQAEGVVLVAMGHQDPAELLVAGLLESQDIFSCGGMSMRRRWPAALVTSAQAFCLMSLPRARRAAAQAAQLQRNAGTPSHAPEPRIAISTPPPIIRADRASTSSQVPRNGPSPSSLRLVTAAAVTTASEDGKFIRRCRVRGKARVAAAAAAHDTNRHECSAMAPGFIRGNHTVTAGDQRLPGAHCAKARRGLARVRGPCQQLRLSGIRLEEINEGQDPARRPAMPREPAPLPSPGSGRIPAHRDRSEIPWECRISTSRVGISSRRELPITTTCACMPSSSASVNVPENWQTRIVRKSGSADG